MKPVLVVVSQLTGHGPTGVETHFKQILALADEQGVETGLITPHGGFSVRKKFTGAVTRMLRQTHPEYAVIWYRWAHRRRLRQRLKTMLKAYSGRPVTLYAQDPLTAQAALDVRRGRDCRVVAVVHFNVSEAGEMAERGLTTQGGSLWRELMRTEREALPRVDRIVFVSDFMRRVVNERVPEIAHVPQAVISNFPAMPDAMAGEASPMADLIAIGTLEPRKNQAFLLQVLAACKMRGRVYTLTLVGDGPDRTRLESLVNQLGLAGQVRFLGFQPAAASLIPRHRAFVHAARMESQGIALIEALSYKRPILAAPVGGIPEVFVNGREGGYWGLDDPKAAAERLIETLEDAETWQRMSSEAWQTFMSRFHPEVLGQSWMDALIGSDS